MKTRSWWLVTLLGLAFITMNAQPAFAKTMKVPNPNYALTQEIYLVAHGNDQGFWIQKQGNTTWTELGNEKFQGAPAVSYDSVSDSLYAAIYIAGVDTNGVLQVGTYHIADGSFSGWYALSAPLPGQTCLATPAMTVAQDRLYLSCMTTQHAIALIREPQFTGNNYFLKFTGRWIGIGGGLSQPPTMATDGQYVLIFAQAPQFLGDKTDWYSLINVTTGNQAEWRNFLTTCNTTPSVTYNGVVAQNYLVTCIADDNHHLYQNTFTVSPTTSSLTGWVNFDVADNMVFTGQTESAIDTNDNVVLQTAIGLNNSIYFTEGAGWNALVGNFESPTTGAGQFISPTVIPVYFPGVSQ